MATVHKATCVWTRNCGKENVYPVEGRLTGTLPRWLEGRVARSGPGNIADGSGHHSLLLDALSMSHQFHISGGRVTYRSRFLHNGSVQENAAENRIVVTEFGAATYPDPCATLFRRFKNSFCDAAAPKGSSDDGLKNMLRVKDEVFALHESSYMRNMEKLDALGNKITLGKHVAVNKATSHPHSEEDGTVYTLGSSFSTAKGPCYNVIQMAGGSPERAKVVASVSCQWRLYPCYYHSFAMTEHYWVLVEQPLVMSARKLVAGAASNQPPFDAMMWLPDRRVRFHVIERDTGSPLQTTYTADAFVTFHHVNAFETRGHLVLDLCATDEGDVVRMHCAGSLRRNRGDVAKLLFRSCLRRYVLPLAGTSRASPGENLVKMNGTTCKAAKLGDGSVHCTHELLYSEFFDMPRINYRKNSHPYRYAYGLSTQGRDMVFERLVKVDVTTGQTWEFAADSHIVGEPIFVAAPDATLEDDGVVLSTLLHKSDPHYVALLVLNARDMSEVARAEFSAEDIVTSTFLGHFVGSHEESHTY